jgi:predicted CXXCH cytochrome family protein
MIVLLGVPAGLGRAQDVSNTPHNLSVSGPGTVKATAEDEICIFCHTPHNASPAAPLWNRADPGRTYTTYTSSTMKVEPGQPSGATRLCLSCHDGTIALGRVLSRPTDIAVTGGSALPPGRTRLGLDLSDDHPVSFDYESAAGASAGTLRPAPRTDGRSSLDRQGRVQCTSCHDAHDNRFGDFLRLDPVRGGLCLVCHDPPGWPQSSHATSTRTWGGPNVGPPAPVAFSTVGDHACGACHVSHQAAGRKRLLQSDVEESVCYACHDGTVAEHDIRTEMNKWRSHDPARSKDVHDPAERPDGNRTHVECVDCHNPHRVSDAAGSGLPGSLRGVSGLDGSEAPLAVATEEYQICYKCHASATESNPDRIARVADQASILLRMDPGNPSYHPVEDAGNNPDVPSLKSPYTVSSVIRCGDCHGNDDPNGPKGAHGSRWDFLLKARYDTVDPNPETAQAYALCYACHDRASVLGDESFRGHRRHVVEQRTACSVCHAAHGIDAAQGDATYNSHLINFDTRVVVPNQDNTLEFVDRGRFAGSCSLKCHDEEHRDAAYGN